LDVASVANLFGLIRMPKIPELKGKKIIGFTPDFTVKTEDVPYLDKMKERARQKRLVVMKEASEAAKKLEEAQALQDATNPTKQLSGAAKKQAKKMEEKLKLNPKWSEEGPRKRKGKHDMIKEEWDELAKEERQYKKLKSGKISQKEYEKSLKNFNDDSDDDDEDEDEDDDDDAGSGSGGGGGGGGGMSDADSDDE
jgi:ATP-dependent RNA helicase DDX55/SPB4